MPSGIMAHMRQGVTGVHSNVYRDLEPSKPAKYRGRHYHTRSEAKWACVLSELGVPFYYEPSTYRLASGLYLPDFWLPTLDAYLEIKPKDVADQRYGQLGEMRGKRVFLASGDLPTIPHCWLEADVYPSLRQRIWLKWPMDEPDYMLAKEAQGRINIVPIALTSSAKGNDPAILLAYGTASNQSFEG